MKKRVIIVIVVTLFAALMAPCVYAAPDLAFEKGKIAVELEYGISPIRSLEVELYRVADVTLVSEKYVFTLTDEFKDAGVTLIVDDLEDSAVYKSQAGALLAYARNNSRSTAGKATSGSDGKVEFADLKSGLYLIARASGSGSYSFDPVLIPLPYFLKTAETAGTWMFEVTSWPKIEYTPPPYTPPNTPPYTPPAEPPTVTPPPVEPLPTAQPPADELVQFIAEVPLAPAPPEEIEIPDPETPLTNLPQTGLMFWPIVFILIAGVALLAIGIILFRRSKKAGATGRKSGI